MTKSAEPKYTAKLKESPTSGVWTAAVYFGEEFVDVVSGPTRELALDNAQKVKHAHANRGPDEVVDL